MFVKVMKDILKYIVVGFKMCFWAKILLWYKLAEMLDFSPGVRLKYNRDKK